MSRLGRILTRSLREGRSVWTMYKDKPLLERIGKAIYTCDFLDPVFDCYYSVVVFIDNVKRLIEYAPIVWEHRTWDYGFVTKFQIKLYEDLYKGIYEDGHHVFTKGQARKLKTVIELLKRLDADDYSKGSYKYLDQKYGEDDIYFKKIPGTEKRPGGPYSTMGSRREDRLTETQKEQYLKERKRLWKLEEYQETQDLKLLHKIIEKQYKKWWD